MPSANESIRDAAIRHQIGVMRFASGEVRKIVELLDETDRDLQDQLLRRLQAIADGRRRSPAVTARLEKLLQDIRALRLEVYRRAGRQLQSDLEDFGTYEVGFLSRMLTNAAAIEISMATTSTLGQIGAIVRERPFQGAILKDWVTDLAANELRAVRQQINIGMAEGQGIDSIVRRIIGSRRAGITGVLDISRRHAETWVRTAISHVANETRDSLYASNSDVIDSVTWLSTLDGRTTDVCIFRDGHRYTVEEHKPLDGGPPWLAGPGRLHAQCRSTGSPNLKSWRALGIEAKEIPPATRASMNGQVPESVTYRDWIQKQPAAVQNSVLGTRRAQAMRAGELQWDQIFTPRGEFRSVRSLELAEG